MAAVVDVKSGRAADLRTVRQGRFVCGNVTGTSPALALEPKGDTTMAMKRLGLASNTCGALFVDPRGRELGVETLDAIVDVLGFQGPRLILRMIGDSGPYTVICAQRAYVPLPGFPPSRDSTTRTSEQGASA